jgi:hypothetical protein
VKFSTGVQQILQAILRHGLRVVSTQLAASGIGNVWQGLDELFSLVHKGFTASIEVTS